MCKKCGSFHLIRNTHDEDRLSTSDADTRVTQIHVCSITDTDSSQSFVSSPPGWVHSFLTQTPSGLMRWSVRENRSATMYELSWLYVMPLRYFICGTVKKNMNSSQHQKCNTAVLVLQ